MAITLSRGHSAGHYSLHTDGYGFKPEGLPGDCTRIQWSAALTTAEAAELSSLVHSRPEINLSAMYLASLDLAWLEEFPLHESFDIFCWNGFVPSELSRLPASTKELGLRGFTERVSIEHISHLRNLTQGWFEGIQRGYQLLGTFSVLGRLLIRETSKLDADYFSLAPSLWSLDLKLGSLKNPELIGKCRGLKYLEIWMSSGLRDIEFISSLTDLQYVFLESLGKVERLPELAGHDDLRRVWIEGLHSLTDLSPIASSPQLSELAVLTCRSIVPESFKPIATLKGLEKVMVNLGSKKRNAQALAVLGRTNEYIDKFNFEYR